MKLKEGIYYNVKFEAIVEIVAILPIEPQGYYAMFDIESQGYYVMFDMGEGRYLLPFKSVEVIESELIVFLGKL